MGKTTNKATAKTTNKEEKVMKNTKKKVEAPVVEETVVTEVAVEEVAPVVEEVKETPVTNDKKVNSFISIEEVTNLYRELGIKCSNPSAKGNYRIMGGGSSLNVKPKKGYFIYTSDDDFANLSGMDLEKSYGDLVLEEGTNAQDHKRPNTVICTELDTLKAILFYYTLNPKNKVVVSTEEATTEVAVAE